MGKLDFHEGLDCEFGRALGCLNSLLTGTSSLLSS